MEMTERPEHEDQPAAMKTMESKDTASPDVEFGPEDGAVRDLARNTEAATGCYHTMVGPVFSDSYDPEFGTRSTAYAIICAMREVVDRIRDQLGERKDIIDVVRGECGPNIKTYFTERDLRVIRFALERALSTI